MKKIINSLLCLLVIFGISGCGTSAKNFEGTSYTFEEVAGSDFWMDGHTNHTVTRTYNFKEGGAAWYEYKCVTDNEIFSSWSVSWEVDGQYLKVTGGLINSTDVFKIEGDRLVSTTDPDYILVKDK